MADAPRSNARLGKDALTGDGGGLGSGPGSGYGLCRGSGQAVRYGKDDALFHPGVNLCARVRSVRMSIYLPKGVRVFASTLNTQHILF